MLKLLRQGRLSKWFSGIGQEAIAVGVVSALEPDDWILPDAPQPRRVHRPRRSTSLQLMRQLLLREGGFTKGRDRTFHFGVLEHRIVGMISHLGAMLPVADGLALAAQLRGERRVAAAFTGDGSTSEGDFHEAVNLAAVWKLPVLFVDREQPVRAVDADERAVRLPRPRRQGRRLRHARRRRRRQRRARGPRGGRARPRRGRGRRRARRCSSARPSACAATRRPRAPTTCRPRSSRSGPRRTRLLRFERELDERGLLPARERETIARAPASRRIDDLADEALAAPAPALHRRSASSPTCTRRAASCSKEPAPEDVARAPRVRYIDAISDGLREAMRRWPEVVLLGQDIAEYGGAFKVTKGFVEEFGKARVRNTPIIESGAIGCAMGLALDGMRPMVEMQFGDFISCGFNQVVNNLAKTHYRWGAAVPGRHPRAGRRRHRRRALTTRRTSSRGSRRGRPEGRGAGDALRRQGAAAVGVRGRQPRAAISSTSSCIARCTATSRRASTPCRSAGARRSRGARCHHRDLRRGRAVGPARGRGVPRHRLPRSR